jgi:hypothetical protein
MCSGTDVIGPELERELRSTTNELLVAMESGVCECEGAVPPRFNCSSPTITAGVLLRTFWLGYTMGETARD